MEKAIAIVGCMDWRLVGLFAVLDNEQMSLESKTDAARKLFKNPGSEGYRKFIELVKRTHGHHVIVLANAGANPQGLPKSLADIAGSRELEAIITVGHLSSTDGFKLGCGGKKAVVGMLTDMANGKAPNDDAYRHFDLAMFAQEMENRGTTLDKFKEMGDTGKLECVDKAWPSVVTNAAKKFSKQVDFLVIDTNDLKLHSDGAHIYRITGDKEDTKIDIGFAVSRMPVELNKTLFLNDWKVAGYSKSQAKKTKVA